MSHTKNPGHPDAKAINWETVAPILKNHLSQFGLNPKHWNLIQKQRHFSTKKISVSISHIHHEQIQFEGIALVSTIQPEIGWEEIRLCA